MSAIYLASRDTRLPWYAKLTAFLVVAYAISPINLFPDRILGSFGPSCIGYIVVGLSHSQWPDLLVHLGIALIFP
ncbi:MAG: DUF1232 domain-containing protein [Nitrospirales bacterium]|nr:DUF1232 domain-containing protein [Nitrospirales bacterium]